MLRDYTGFVTGGLNAGLGMDWVEWFITAEPVTGGLDLVDGLG